MQIVESWEYPKNQIYDIGRHSKNDPERYNVKESEAMYMFDGELYPFGGTVGYRIADFDTLEETQEFLLNGIGLQDTNPEIWLEMVEMR